MENIQDKIRKLLRLAKDKGASEHEAATALAMANKLMLQHNIDHIEDEGHDGPNVVSGDAVHFEEKVVKWHIFVAGAVGELYRCRFTHGSRSITFHGRKINVDMASETLSFVIHQVEALYKEGLKAFRNSLGRLDKETRGEFRQTFKEACALRLFQRAKEIIAQRKNEIPQHMALVVIDDQMKHASDFVEANFGKSRTIAIRKSGFGTGAGFAAGSQVRLDKNPLHK